MILDRLAPAVTSRIVGAESDRVRVAIAVGLPEYLRLSAKT